MLLLIIAVMVACIAFGLPFLPVLVAGGLGMALLAFYLTRDRRILNLAIGLFMVAGTHYIVGGIFHDMPDAQEIIPAWIATLLNSDRVVGFTSVIVILLSLFYGIFGPIQNMPTDMAGVLRMVKDEEKKQHDSKTEK